LPETLLEQQDIDLELKLWKDYLLREKLSEDEKKAKELVLGQSQFEVKDRVCTNGERQNFKSFSTI